jgi:N-acetylneuraminic acid mutarotase
MLSNLFVEEIPMQTSKLRLLSCSLFGSFLGFAFFTLSTTAQTTAPNEWTWVGGSSGAGQNGLYGTLGTPAPGNIPGGRYGTSSWTDSGGNLWLFGGDGFDAIGNYGYLNDLWKFSPSTNEWTWMGGSSKMICCDTKGGFGHPGVYGTLGTPAVGNMPGGRDYALSFTDSSGHLWLFGGAGDDANGTYGLLNDLWEYSPSTGEWAWMSGSNTVNQPGVYGKLGTPVAGNIPGGRTGATGWTDSSGHLWLFGGSAYDTNDNNGWLNDLWVFIPSSNEWAWMGGSSTVALSSGVYGVLGTPAPGNIPAGRTGAASWTDSSDHLWLFGGFGFGSGPYAPNYDGGALDDLWEFNPSTNEWAWMGGSSVALQSGEYGTLGTPAPGNISGGRSDATNWTDSGGHFWLFGGVGEDADDYGGDLNDLWEYSPSTNEWAWMGGGSTSGFNKATGVYGTLGTPAAENIPGGRDSAAGWTDGSGHFWLFAGYGYDPLNLDYVVLGDFWEYQPSSAPLPAPDFSVAIFPSSLTVQPGQSVTTNVTVAPAGGFSSTVSLSCSGLPSGASCSFSPATITPPGASVSTTLTVTTSANSATLHRDSLPLLPGSALAAALCCFGIKKRKRLPKLLLLAISVAGLSLLNGCGGPSSSVAPPPPQAFTVTVTATSGSLSHTASFGLFLD